LRKSSPNGFWCPCDFSHISSHAALPAYHVNSDWQLIVALRRIYDRALFYRATNRAVNLAGLEIRCRYRVKIGGPPAGPEGFLLVVLR